MTDPTDDLGAGDVRADVLKPDSPADSLQQPKPEAPRSQSAPSGKPEQQYVIDALAGESWRLFRIMGEFVQGFEEMSDVTKAVTIFGSARLGAGHPYFAQAERLALPEGALVLSCTVPGGPVDLAMAPSTVTGFLAWLESRPPGATLPR